MPSEFSQALLAFDLELVRPDKCVANIVVELNQSITTLLRVLNWSYQIQADSREGIAEICIRDVLRASRDEIGSFLSRIGDQGVTQHELFDWDYARTTATQTAIDVVLAICTKEFSRSRIDRIERSAASGLLSDNFQDVLRETINLHRTFCEPLK